MCIHSKPPREAEAISSTILAELEEFLQTEYNPGSQELDQMKELSPQSMLGQLRTMQVAERIKQANEDSIISIHQTN